MIIKDVREIYINDEDYLNIFNKIKDLKFININGENLNVIEVYKNDNKHLIGIVIQDKIIEGIDDLKTSNYIKKIFDLQLPLIEERYDENGGTIVLKIEDKRDGLDKFKILLQHKDDDFDEDFKLNDISLRSWNGYYELVLKLKIK